MSKLPYPTHYGGGAARNVHASYSQAEIAKIDAALNAWGVIRKTFYSWITLAEGVAVIRGKADSIGGRWTFQQLLDEAGLGALADKKNKATATRLVQINACRGEVIQWYENDLTEMQQARWAAPTSIFAHCPVFLRHKPAPNPSKPTLRTEVARLQEEADAANARARKAEQVVSKGSLFEFTDTAENIAKVFEQNASLSKIEDLIRELQAVVKRLKARKTKPDNAAPTPADGGRTRVSIPEFPGELEPDPPFQDEFIRSKSPEDLVLEKCCDSNPRTLAQIAALIGTTKDAAEELLANMLTRGLDLEMMRRPRRARLFRINSPRAPLFPG